MSKQTHTNPLSKREVETLRGNPYIASATTKTVRFTEEFKRMAYEGKQQGITISETMRLSVCHDDLFDLWVSLLDSMGPTTLVI